MWQDDFVQVVNETDEDITWDSAVYHPGQRKTVPFLQMRNSFGDPRALPTQHQIYVTSSGDRGVIQPRDMERLKVSGHWMVGHEAIPTWNDIPALTFYNMDGERLWTVRDDPTGTHVSPANPTVESQIVLESTIKRQQAQIDQLLAVSGLDRDALPAVPPTHASDIPVDDSTAEGTQSPWAHSQEEVS